MNPAPKTSSSTALQAIRRRAAVFGLDGFLLSLLLLILLAWLWPGIGRSGGPLPLEEVTTYGVALIFFFYGLKLSPEKLKSGLSQWRLHLAIQLTTFLLFPLLVLLAWWLWGSAAQESLWLGAFYLAALPSTVSSSVVMVSIAGGNLPAAIFNASISSLLGVFLTPLWMGLFLQSQSGDFDFWSVLAKLVLQVVVPALLGLLLHKRLGGLADRYRRELKYFDQVIILLIVYAAFCDSFARQLFRGLSGTDLLVLGLLMTGLFFLVFGLVSLMSKTLGLSRENKITALFCGSKKSLVQGTVMSRVLFPDANTVGLVLLPLMLYHALQLIYASMLAQAMARKAVAMENSGRREA
ncbi:MAG: bile acid:sodium symporter family protein [Adhaeribacter sp.]